MDQVLGRMIATVSRYEGTVTQLRGDGLLVFFGAPLAHEDDAERAVRAALDIRESLATYSRELELAYGTILQVRIGLNTGPVVLSRITDVLEIAYNALGDTVNTAARLESAAGAGTILASDTTARLVASLFDLRPIGALNVKGKDTPVQAIEVIGARGTVGKPRGLTGLTSSLVGRDRELQVLRDAMQAVIEGRGQIVAVIGEAGIGKSRLIAEAQRAGAQINWLEGRCLSYAENIPYLPFSDLLHEWLGVAATDPEAKIRIELQAALSQLVGTRADEMYPYLASVVRVQLDSEAAEHLSGLSAESVQRQTFKAIKEWTRRLAEKRPLALTFDDLHWADATSLALVEELLDVTEEAPVLLALLFRPEREHASWRLNDLARQRFPHRYLETVLRPLTDADTEQLVGNLIANIPGELRSLIFQKAEGNPFFVEEVLRTLMESQILVRSGDYWQVTRPVTAMDIPDSIQAVLLARIDHLPDDARQVLQAASVIGRFFSLETLKVIMASNSNISSILGDLQRLELIVERRRIPQVEYRFRHALTQEVTYSSLVDSERRRLHGDVARALEALHADRLDEVLGPLTYHSDQSGDGEAVLRFAPAAAKQASSLGAHREAAAHYATALHYAEGLAPEQHAALLEERSYECYLTDQLEAALRASSEALIIWQAFGHREKEGQRLRWLSRIAYMLGRRDEATRYGAMAVEALETLPPGRELAMAYSNQSQLYMNYLETTEAIRWGVRAIELARAIADHVTLAHAEINVAAAERYALHSDDMERVRIKLEEHLRHALEHGFEDHAARCYTNLTAGALFHRDYPRAEGYIEEGTAYCAARDLETYVQYLRARRAQLRLAQGDWAAAAAEATAVLGKTELRFDRVLAMLVLTLVHVRRGDRQVWAMLDAARELARATGMLQWISLGATARAEAAWLDGDLETCLAEARAGFDLALALRQPGFLGELSLWMWRAGGLRAPPEGIAVPFALQIAGDWPAAAAEWERIGCPYERAWALADGDEAAQRSALAIFERLGAAPAADITRRSLQE